MNTERTYTKEELDNIIHSTILSLQIKFRIPDKDLIASLLRVALEIKCQSEAPNQ